MEKHCITVNIRGGVRVVTSADASTMTSYVLLEQEDWFEHEMEFIRAFVAPGMHALDIGANHGVYGLTFAACLQGCGHVWAFEPTAAPYSMLTNSIVANGCQSVLTPIRCGLSDRPRDALMYVSANSELNTLHGQTGPTENVRLESLDALLPELTASVSIDFVKLDAEGEEVNILKGGVHFFTIQSPLVMFEVRHGSELNHGLWDAFVALGYQLFRHLPGPNVLAPVDVRQSFEPYELNLFAAKQDRQQELTRRGLLMTAETQVPAGMPLLHWQDVFENLPYASTFLPHWTAKHTDPALRGRHEVALNHYLTSQVVYGDAAQRVALLRSAAEIWRDIQAVAPEHLSVGLCLARVTFDLGQRDQAVRLLVKTMRATAGATTHAFTLPFLPPASRCDRLPPQGSMLDWLNAAMLAAYEQWRAFSSFFSRDTSGVLQPHLGNPNLTAELRRRYLLHARRAGILEVPVDTDPFLRHDTGNLNPEFWSELVR